MRDVIIDAFVSVSLLSKHSCCTLIRCMSCLRIVYKVLYEQILLFCYDKTVTMPWTAHNDVSHNSRLNSRQKHIFCAF